MYILIYVYVIYQTKREVTTCCHHATLYRQLATEICSRRRSVEGGVLAEGGDSSSYKRFKLWLNIPNIHKFISPHLN